MFQNFYSVFLRNRKVSRAVDVDKMEKPLAKQLRRVTEACEKAKLIPGHAVVIEGSVGIVQFVDVSQKQMLISHEHLRGIEIAYFEDIEQYGWYTIT